MSWFKRFCFVCHVDRNFQVRTVELRPGIDLPVDLSLSTPRSGTCGVSAVAAGTGKLSRSSASRGVHDSTGGADDQGLASARPVAASYHSCMGRQVGDDGQGSWGRGISQWVNYRKQDPRPVSGISSPSLLLAWDSRRPWRRAGPMSEGEQSDGGGRRRLAASSPGPGSHWPFATALHMPEAISTAAASNWHRRQALCPGGTAFQVPGHGSVPYFKPRGRGRTTSAHSTAGGRHARPCLARLASSAIAKACKGVCCDRRGAVSISRPKDPVASGRRRGSRCAVADFASVTQVGDSSQIPGQTTVADRFRDGGAWPALPPRAPRGGHGA